MRKLILIKHARPEIDPAVPSDQWRLSDAGRLACDPLAERLRPHAPQAIFTSEEPKAIETGELLASHLGLVNRTVAGLQEHDRSNVPHMQSRDFIAAIALFFQRRGQLVLGRETADQALARFASAIDQAVGQAPEGNIAIVTHGTVLSLFVAAHSNEDGFRLWRALQLPAMVVMSLPALDVLEIIPSI